MLWLGRGERDGKAGWMYESGDGDKRQSEGPAQANANLLTRWKNSGGRRCGGAKHTTPKQIVPLESDDVNINFRRELEEAM